MSRASPTPPRIRQRGAPDPWHVIATGANLLSGFCSLLLVFLVDGTTRVFAAITAVLMLLAGLLRVLEYRSPKRGRR